MNRIVSLVLPALFLPTAALAITSTALNGSLSVDAGGYASYTVKVPAILPGTPRITGHLATAGGPRNDIRVLVFTKADFDAWERHEEVTPLFQSGRESSVDLDLPVPNSGTYVVVLSNTFSPISSKIVSGKLGLTWDPPYAAVVAIVALAAGVALSTRRKREEDVEEPPQDLAKAA